MTQFSISPVKMLMNVTDILKNVTGQSLNLLRLIMVWNRYTLMIRMATKSVSNTQPDKNLTLTYKASPAEIVI